MEKNHWPWVLSSTCQCYGGETLLRPEEVLGRGKCYARNLARECRVPRGPICSASTKTCGSFSLDPSFAMFDPSTWRKAFPELMRDELGV